MDGTENQKMYKCPITGREHRYAPPVEWTPPTGQVSFHADQEWEALVERGLSFPDYEGPSYISRVRGDCLEPLITDQHVLRARSVSPDEQLIDGGIYALELGASASDAAVYRNRMGIPAEETIVIAKVLRFIGYEWYAVCKDSLVSLNEYGDVIAMIVAVLPLDSGSLIESEVHARQECGQVNLNAATTTLTVSYAAAAVANSSVGINTNIARITVGPFSIDTTVIVTASGQITNINTNSDEARWWFSTVSSTSAVNIGQSKTSLPGSASASLILEASVSLLAGDTQTYWLNGVGAGSIGGGYTATGMMKVEVIKR